MIDPRRPGRYRRIYDQLQDLIEGRSPGLTAAMATICAVLHHKMPHHFWTGFYFLAGQERLHIGPYQGPVACQVLEGGGVCLHCARTGKPVIVPDVEQFPGHIACDPRSRSEIAIPVLRGDHVVAVLDVDSVESAQFDADDVAPLERIVGLLGPYL
ncbi:MAG: GAF domain-containing protein [Chloroflexota bacterium]